MSMSRPDRLLHEIDSRAEPGCALGRARGDGQPAPCRIRRRWSPPGVAVDGDVVEVTADLLAAGRVVGGGQRNVRYLGQQRRQQAALQRSRKVLGLVLAGLGQSGARRALSCNSSWSITRDARLLSASGSRRH